MAGLTPGLATTVDPLIGTLLGSMRSAAQSVNAVFTNPAGAPNVNQFTFFNIGGQTRRFPTVRLDANLGKNHHLENITNYQQFDGIVDFLNNVDPAFPDFRIMAASDRIVSRTLRPGVGRSRRPSLTRRGLACKAERRSSLAKLRPTNSLIRAE
jgi:hypothetical protein